MAKSALLTFLSLAVIAASQAACTGAQCPVESEDPASVNLLQTTYAMKKDHKIATKNDACDASCSTEKGDCNELWQTLEPKEYEEVCYPCFDCYARELDPCYDQCSAAYQSGLEELDLEAEKTCGACHVAQHAEEWPDHECHVDCTSGDEGKCKGCVQKEIDAMFPEISGDHDGNEMPFYSNNMPEGPCHESCVSDPAGEDCKACVEAELAAHGGGNGGSPPMYNMPFYSNNMPEGPCAWECDSSWCEHDSNPDQCQEDVKKYCDTCHKCETKCDKDCLTGMVNPEEFDKLCFDCFDCYAQELDPCYDECQAAYTADDASDDDHKVCQECHEKLFAENWPDHNCHGSCGSNPAGEDCKACVEDELKAMHADRDQHGGGNGGSPPMNSMYSNPMYSPPAGGYNSMYSPPMNNMYPPPMNGMYSPPMNSMYSPPAGSSNPGSIVRNAKAKFLLHMGHKLQRKGMPSWLAKNLSTITKKANQKKMLAKKASYMKALHARRERAQRLQVLQKKTQSDRP